MNTKLITRNLRRRYSHPQLRLLIDRYGVRVYVNCFGNTRYAKGRPA